MNKTTARSILSAVIFSSWYTTVSVLIASVVTVVTYYGAIALHVDPFTAAVVTLALSMCLVGTRSAVLIGAALIIAYFAGQRVSPIAVIAACSAASVDIFGKREIVRSHKHSAFAIQAVAAVSALFLPGILALLCALVGQAAIKFVCNKGSRAIIFA